jgi:hypothetical protein
MACGYFSFELNFPTKRTGVGAHNSTRPKPQILEKMEIFFHSGPSFQGDEYNG